MTGIVIDEGLFYNCVVFVVVKLPQAPKDDPQKR